MKTTTIIGLEVHVQLLTETKLFSGAINKFAPEAPNTHVDPVTLGLPGTLPVMNRKAYELAVKVGLALNCDIAPFTKWDRKQYYYPDLPKAYQISQYDLPLCHDGYLEIDLPDGGGQKRIGIIRAHLEEDAGKNMHAAGGDSRVDLNRAGTPLSEIVSEPDIRSAAEAKAYLQELKLLMSYLGVSDCNMQEGSLRCDVNINLHLEKEDGKKVATPIVEIKNMNSFNGVEAAILYEEKRQLEAFEKTGKTIDDAPKATRGFDLDRGVTYPMREKEEAADYRYFPDPDLTPVTITDAEVETIRATMGEFPADRRSRFVAALELSAYDAGVIIDQGVAFADYFEEVHRACGDPKRAANWCTQDVLRDMNERGEGLVAFSAAVPASVLGGLLRLIGDGDLTTAAARDEYAKYLGGDYETAGGTTPEDALAHVRANAEAAGALTVKDTGALEAAIAAVLDKPSSDKAIEAVKGGKQQAVGPLIGQVMKEVKGADPKTVREMLIAAIEAC